MTTHHIIQGDCLARLKELPSESVHCVVTSPPYFGLRDYGTASWNGGDMDCDHKGEPMRTKAYINQNTSDFNDVKNGESFQPMKAVCTKCGAERIDNQIGLESTPQLFITKMVEVFEEVRRVLRSDGVLFLNLGDSYAGSWGNYGGENRGNGSQREINGGSSVKDQEKRNGSYLPPTANAPGFKPKDLMLMPHRVAIALQDAGWWVRSDMPWVKRSAMPESVTDRPAKALEYVFQLTKSKDYFFDMEAVRVRMTDLSIERLSQDTASLTGSVRVPGKTNGNMKAVGNRDRSLPSNRNGEHGNLDETPAGGRNFRNSDLWYSSIAAPHGMVSSQDEIVGLDVNPAGFKDSTERHSLSLVRVGDALSGDMMHIALPSCSICADSFDRAASVLYGEHESVFWSRIERIGNYLSAALVLDFAPTVRSLVLGLEERKSDCSPLPYLISAIARNNQNRKTGLDLLTSLSCKPFSQILSRIADTLDGLALSVLYVSICENSISLDGWDAHLLAQIPHYKSDKVSCSYCPVYRVNVQKTSHFATFPTKLVEPLIKAGTSEHGCCKDCGAPWERTVDRKRIRLDEFASTDPRYRPNQYHGAYEEINGKGDAGYSEVTTTGWQKTCKCNTDERVPCTVLDPFAGAGTTMLVAKRLKRNSIGIELNPEYIEMIERRLEHWHRPNPPQVNNETDLPLFAA